MRISFYVRAILLCAGSAFAATAQSTGGVTTVPHPPSPSLTQIESEARRTARWPGERRGTFSGSERKRLETLRAPQAEDVVKYRDFLKLENTGIIRLFPDADCITKHLVRVDGDCARHVPGASGVSFRGKNSNDDLRLVNGDLSADGFFSVSMIVDLGAVSVETLGLTSEGVDHLSKYEPASNLREALRDYLMIRAGESAGRFHFSNRVAAVAGNTYAARVVAFEGDNIGIKILSRNRSGVVDLETQAKFSALRYDNRRDVIAVFRIIRQDDDGGVTILWKRLADRKAPKLRFEDEQPLKDFK